MAPPFEIPVALDVVLRWLWALRHASGARGVYRQDLLKREIVGYLAPLRCFELHEAVDAALGPEGSGEVRLVRNVTLPAPLNHKSLCNRHGSTILWAMIDEGRCLTLRSVGGLWRIRHHVPGGNGVAGCALFCLGHQAELRVHSVDFEIVCVRTANPVKANFAVLPPLQEAARGVSLEETEDELEEVQCIRQTKDCLPILRAIEPSGTLVELSDCTEVRGYDSRLVVRGSWPFKGVAPTASWMYYAEQMLSDLAPSL